VQCNLRARALCTSRPQRLLYIVLLSDMPQFFAGSIINEARIWIRMSTSSLPQLSADAKSEISAHFLIVITSMLGCAVGIIGLSFYSLPFLSGPLATFFGRPATSVTLAASFFVFGLIAAAPIAGRLCDRVGAHRVITVSVLLEAVDFVALSQIRGSIWTLYCGYFMLGVVGAGTTYAIYGRVIVSCFNRSRGLALGIMMSGPGIAAALLPVILPPVIKVWGWRSGYLLLAAMALSVLPLVLVALRQWRSDAAVATSTSTDGLTLREAARTRQFWAMAIGVLFIMSAIIGTHINLVAILTARGKKMDFIRVVASTYGFSTILGRLVSGYLLDRVRAPLLAAIIFTATSLAFVLIILGPGWSIFVAITLLGLSSGAEGDICGYLVSRFFGMRSYAEIFGWIFSSLSLGLAAGAAVASLLISLSGGSYDLWLCAAAILCVAAALLFGTLGRYPHRSVSARQQLLPFYMQE